MQPAARPRHFASDNNAGICPEAWTAIARANADHAPGYGDDSETHRACDLIRGWLETDAEVYLVFNGTAANALALAAVARSYHAVLCHAHAHIERDECAAPEFFTGGVRLIPLPGEHGRLEPEIVARAIESHFPLHASKPAVLSLTQATECGTVYRPEQIRALAEVAHRNGLRVHMDGARLANALAFLGASPADATWRAGVDILSLGMTKNGGLCCEAIVVFDRALTQDLEYRVKQGGQLASKMRFLAASWTGLLSADAWLRHARHANDCARQLATRLASLPGVSILHPCEANGVFVDLPPRVIEGLHGLGWRFYVFEGATGCRLMCSWDTTQADLDELVSDVKRLLPGA